MLMCGMMTAVTIAQTADSLALKEVVVTGTRNATDVRHLPMTVTVIDRDLLTADHQMSVLPTVMREVPGLFVTSRSMMGYGVSTGAAGGINLRGITGGAGQLMVLIDGHPQYDDARDVPLSPFKYRPRTRAYLELRAVVETPFGRRPHLWRKPLLSEG